MSDQSIGSPLVPSWPSVSQWAEASGLQRCSHSVSSLGKNTVVALFGESDKGPREERKWLKDAALLNIDSQIWMQVDVQGDPCPRSSHAAATWTEKEIIIFGGYDGTNYLDDLSLIRLEDAANEGDAPSLKFIKGERLHGCAWPAARKGASLTHVTRRGDQKGSWLYLFGGQDASQMFDDVWVFDLNTWKPPVRVSFSSPLSSSSLTSPSAGDEAVSSSAPDAAALRPGAHSMHSAMYDADSDSIFIIGFSPDTSTSNGLLRFDLATNTWSTVSVSPAVGSSSPFPLFMNRAFHAASLLPSSLFPSSADGTTHILVVGGQVYSTSPEEAENNVRDGFMTQSGLLIGPVAVQLICIESSVVTRYYSIGSSLPSEPASPLTRELRLLLASCAEQDKPSPHTLTPSAFHAMCTVGSRVIVCGGINQPGTPPSGLYWTIKNIEDDSESHHQEEEKESTSTSSVFSESLSPAIVLQPLVRKEPPTPRVSVEAVSSAPASPSRAAAVESSVESSTEILGQNIIISVRSDGRKSSPVRIISSSSSAAAAASSSASSSSVPASSPDPWDLVISVISSPDPDPRKLEEQNSEEAVETPLEPMEDPDAPAFPLATLLKQQQEAEDMKIAMRQERGRSPARSVAGPRSPLRSPASSPDRPFSVNIKAANRLIQAAVPDVKLVIRTRLDDDGNPIEGEAASSSSAPMDDIEEIGIDAPDGSSGRRYPYGKKNAMNRNRSRSPPQHQSPQHQQQQYLQHQHQQHHHQQQQQHQHHHHAKRERSPVAYQSKSFGFGKSPLKYTQQEQQQHHHEHHQQEHGGDGRANKHFRNRSKTPPSPIHKKGF